MLNIITTDMKKKYDNLIIINLYLCVNYDFLIIVQDNSKTVSTYAEIDVATLVT